MQQINKTRPDIKITNKGVIEIYSKAAKRLGLEKERGISFTIDEEDNVYIKRDRRGMNPSAIIGRNHLRFYSIKIARIIQDITNAGDEVKELLFRIGDAEDNTHFPIITRNPL